MIIHLISMRAEKFQGMLQQQQQRYNQDAGIDTGAEDKGQGQGQVGQ